MASSTEPVECELQDVPLDVQKGLQTVLEHSNIFLCSNGQESLVDDVLLNGKQNGFNVQNLEGNDEASSDDEPEKSDEISSTSSSMSSDVRSTSQESAIGPKKKKKARKKKPFVKAYKPPPPNLNFKRTLHVQESHGKEIYGLAVNQVAGSEYHVATCGANRISIYEMRALDTEVIGTPEEEKGNFCSLLCCFEDPNAQEVFYTCAWTNIAFKDGDQGGSKEATHLYTPLLAAAGLKGTIRLVDAFTTMKNEFLQGHGDAVNDLRFHPIEKDLLLSAGQDHTLKLWNVFSGVLVAQFGAPSGHIAAVYSCDFHSSGDRFASAAEDHTVRVWAMTDPRLKETIAKSRTYSRHQSSNRRFKTWVAVAPMYATASVHTNYVDCVRYFGDSILSKSCEHEIVLWRPVPRKPSSDPAAPVLTAGSTAGAVMLDEHSASGINIIRRFDLEENYIWYIRFALDRRKQRMAIGNIWGRITVWDMDVQSPDEVKSVDIQCAKGRNNQVSQVASPVRICAFSADGNTLYAVDDKSMLWRFDKPAQ